MVYRVWWRGRREETKDDERDIDSLRNSPDCTRARLVELSSSVILLFPLRLTDCVVRQGRMSRVIACIDFFFTLTYLFVVVVFYFCFVATYFFKFMVDV